MEHDEKVVHVSSALVEVNSIHDAVSLLQEVESPLELFFLDVLGKEICQLLLMSPSIIAMERGLTLRYGEKDELVSCC